MTSLTASVEFHELAMDYRAARVPNAQAAYECLCAFLEERESTLRTIIATKDGEIAALTAEVTHLAGKLAERDASMAPTARLQTAAFALHDAVNKHVAAADRTSLGAAFEEMDNAMAAALDAGVDCYGAPRFDFQVIASLESLGYTREIPSCIPQPYAGAIALLETFAQTGMVVTGIDGKPTPNAVLCMRFADELRAALAAPHPVDAAQAVPGQNKRDRINATWPQRIYLQTENEHGNGAEPFNPRHEITWCQDQIGSFDIEYVRADLTAAPLAQPTDTTKEM